MADKVDFDGLNHLIIIKTGITSIDVKSDMYSTWKEWSIINPQWSNAFYSFGGDPTTTGQTAPAYFFLTNGWKVYIQNTYVNIETNLYSDDGLSPFIINNGGVSNKTSDSPIIREDYTLLLSTIQNVDEKVTVISGLTIEMNQSVLYMTSGFTEILSGFTEINESISGMTDSINIMSEQVENMDNKLSYLSGTTYEMNQNVIIMTSGFTEINDSISGMTESLDVVSTLVSEMYLSIANMENEIKRILGLSQENFRIVNQSYGSDNLLDSATIKIYSNSSDCDSDINPLATYSMIALYDGSGRLINYKVSKN